MTIGMLGRRGIGAMVVRTLAALMMMAISSSAAMALEIRQVAVTANDIVYDKVSGKLYASVPGNAVAYPNSIAVINVETGTVEAAVWVGSEPNRLAVSGDGQYLYVGLDGAASVRRVHLPTLTPGLQFGIPGGEPSGPNVALNIAVMPGSPQTVAVVRQPINSSATNGIAIYDDGVQRPVATTEVYGPTTLAFGADGTALYGSYNGTIFAMSVASAGVSVFATRESSSGCSGQLKFDAGLLYCGEVVVNPTSLLPRAVLPAPEWLRAVAIDSVGGVVFGLGYDPGSSTVGVTAYDTSTLRSLWSLPIPLYNGAYYSCRLERTPDGVATKSDKGQVFVIDLRNSSSLRLATVGTGWGTVGTTAVSESCGENCSYLLPEGTFASLVATPASGSVFVGWEGDPDCADGTVTMTEARSCVAHFRYETPGLSSRAHVRSNDIAYSALTGKLYASVPGIDPVRGNSIVEIDPISGEIGASVWVGSEPNRLAVSDDGAYLYVGLDGAAAVRSVHLPTLTPGLQFSLGGETRGGWSIALDMAVMPGSPQTVAVVRKRTSWSGTNGVAIYDGGVQRPVVTTDLYGPTTLAFGAGGSALYGAYENAFFELGVSDSGVTLVTKREGSKWCVGRLKFGSGLLYCGGTVVDATTLAPVGTVGVSNSPSGIALGLADGMILGVRDYSPDGLAAFSVNAYDANTLRFLWSLSVPGPSDASYANLIERTPSGIAIRSRQGQVVAIDLRSSAPLRLSKGGTGFGDVQVPSERMTCGEDCSRLLPLGAVVTLAAAPMAGSRFVGWEGDPDCKDGSVTMAAARSCIAVFQNLTSGRGTVVHVPANDIVYSSLTGKLYGSVSGSDPSGHR
jgi:sugar lactone lactonase YvrE